MPFYLEEEIAIIPNLILCLKLFLFRHHTQSASCSPVQERSISPKSSNPDNAPQIQTQISKSVFLYSKQLKNAESSFGNYVFSPIL